MSSRGREGRGGRIEEEERKGEEEEEEEEGRLCSYGLYPEF